MRRSRPLHPLRLVIDRGQGRVHRSPSTSAARRRPKAGGTGANTTLEPPIPPSTPAWQRDPLPTDRVRSLIASPAVRSASSHRDFSRYESNCWSLPADDRGWRPSPVVHLGLDDTMERLLYTGALRISEGLEDQTQAFREMDHGDWPTSVMSTWTWLGGVVEREQLPPRESSCVHRQGLPSLLPGGVGVEGSGSLGLGESGS